MQSDKINPVKARLRALKKGHKQMPNVQQAKFKLRKQFHKFAKEIIGTLEAHSTPDTGRQIAFLDGLRSLYDICKQAAAIPSYDKYMQESDEEVPPPAVDKEVEFAQEDMDEAEAPATQTF